MAIWKNGHIAYVGEGLKIYEAANTAKDMCVSDFVNRANGFQELLIVAGSALESEGNTSEKPQNPYTEAAEVLKYIPAEMNTVKDSVKWLKWELNETGYNLNVDGKCGPKTDAALKAFQASCKIEVDGKCGPDTRAHLKAA